MPYAAWGGSLVPNSSPSTVSGGMPNRMLPLMGVGLWPTLLQVVLLPISAESIPLVSERQAG